MAHSDLQLHTYRSFPSPDEHVCFHAVSYTHLQAVIFSDGGPGCRWVGNEHGFAGDTNWSFLRAGEVYPGYPKYRELQYGHADGNQWVAAELSLIHILSPFTVVECVKSEVYKRIRFHFLPFHLFGFGNG